MTEKQWFDFKSFCLLKETILLPHNTVSGTIEKVIMTVQVVIPYYSILTMVPNCRFAGEEIVFPQAICEQEQEGNGPIRISIHGLKLFKFQGIFPCLNKFRT